MTVTVQAVLDGSRRALARALTAVESESPDAPALLAALYPHTGKAWVVGITGASGALYAVRFLKACLTGGIEVDLVVSDYGQRLLIEECGLNLKVDDLAAWIVHAARERVDGTFNATGPTTTLGEVIETGRRVVGPHAPPATPVPADVLEHEGVAEWMGPRSLPLWISDPEWRWFATLDTSAARANGLRARPLEETLRRTLAYEESRTEPRGTGLTDDEEIALRTALHGSVGG